MKFGLIDRIVELVRGDRIIAVKAVSRAEEYLVDHFPTFPVLPGVLILEALTESAAWLVRDAQDFACSIILLREARNVTYRSFVKPGDLLRLEVECRKLARETSDFSGTAYCGQVEVAKARFGLRHFSVGTEEESSRPVDRRVIAEARAEFASLRR